MRARTKQEIVRGYSKLREEKDRKRKLPFKILAVVLLLGGAVKVYLDHGDRIRAEAARASAAVRNWTDGMRDPKNYSPVKSAEAPSAPPESAPVAPENALRAHLHDPPAAAASTPPPTPIRHTASIPDDPPSPAPKPLVKNAWRVTGSVFDLASLNRVSYAKIEFAREGHDSVSGTTDADGAYEVDLPKGEGWTVSARSPKHRRGQLVDLDPSYRARDIDERRAAFEQVNDGDLTPAAVEWGLKQTRVRLDLVVVPTHWTDGANN